MKTEALQRRDHGTVNVELCFACAGIWFDHWASVELAPAAVISLFKEIHAHQDVARQSVAERMGCPRCGDALVLSYDVSKSGRFSYYRCPRGDGRFTPFFQFLREKQFVRSLTPVEIEQVRAQVRQVNCSQCGAPVDLELGTQCQYCHAPLSVLDADAVEKAVRMWSEVQQHQQRVPPSEAAAQAILQGQRAAAQQSSSLATHPRAFATWSATTSLNLSASPSGIDLVGSAIGLLGSWLFDSKD
jgi:hypothetical protein